MLKSSLSFNAVLEAWDLCQSLGSELEKMQISFQKIALALGAHARLPWAAFGGGQE